MTRSGSPSRITARPFATGRSCVSTWLRARSSSGVFLGGRATYLAHVGTRLLASVEYNGSHGSGPSLIVALDWRTGRVLARREFPRLIGPLAKSGKDLWALQVRPAALLRLDPLTLAPTAAPIRLSPGQAMGLAAAGGYVWTTEPDAGEVLRIDTSDPIRQSRPCRRLPRRSRRRGGQACGSPIVTGARSVGSTRRRFDRPGGPIQVGGKPGWLASAGRYLFAADPTRGTVTRIDLRSGETVGPPIRVAPPAKARRLSPSPPQGTPSGRAASHRAR